MAEFSPEAEKILSSRYYLKDKRGNPIEDGNQMLERVASCVSAAEKTGEQKKLWHDKFLSIMDSLEFLPNSPTLMNAGSDRCLSACFTLRLEDNLSNIFETVKQVALIHKAGGGTGILFSNIRPANSMVFSTQGVASGPVSFMRVFEASTDVIKQGGKRRGANLGLLSVHHPDIFEFVTSKQDNTQFQNFNISVSATDDFISAVCQGSNFLLKNPFTHEKTSCSATKLFDLICKQAWLNGEPGLIFIDAINAKNPTPWLGRIECVNPCLVGDTFVHTTRGKIPIKDLVGKNPWVFCSDGNGKVQLRKARDIRRTGRNREVWKLTYKSSNGREQSIVATPEHLVMMFDGTYRKLQDLSIGDSIMPFYQRKRNQRCYSKSFVNHKVIGIEFCGHEDVFNMEIDDFHNFAANGIIVHNCGEAPLLPEEACNLGSIDVSKIVTDHRINWDRLEEVVSIAVRFLDDVISVNHYPNVKIARKTLRTRKIGLGVMGWADLLLHLGIRYDDDKAIKLAKRLMMNIRETAHIASRELGKEKGYCFDQLKRRNAQLTVNAPTGTLSILAGCSSGIEPIFGADFTKTVMNGVKLDLGKKYKKIDMTAFVSASNVSVEKHIEMQAAFQSYTDGAVSKTINLPSSATVDDVKKAFLLAHSSGCKGITVYRDGSRDAPMKAANDDSLSECENGKCLI